MTKKCLLEINDEVNAKFHNLEVSDRRQLVKKFEFEVPGAKFLPSVRLGRWNGKKSFFSLGGSTFINCLPEALKYLVDQGYDIELVDNRDYQTSFEFDLITEDTLKHKTWPEGHALEGQPIVPRSHQIEVVNAFLQNPQSLVVAATGSGKTLITGILSLRVEKYGRSIVIVPNTDLVNQTFKDYDNLGLDVGVFYGAKKDLGKKHTICTWQSLNSMLKNTLKGEAEVTIDEFLDDVVCVIVDECFAAGTPILTPTGYTPIEQLKPGDIVINYDEQTNQFKEDYVIKLHENLVKSTHEKMYEIQFDNGTVLEVTGNHKFLTDTGWVRADELTENHNIINYALDALCHDIPK
jgi:hypothetical protein